MSDLMEDLAKVMIWEFHGRARDFIRTHHATIKQNAEDARVYKMLLDEAHEHHRACIKDAYELLGIDGSDGEYRYKWIALELHDVKKNAEDAKRFWATTQAMEEILIGGAHIMVQTRADEILREGEPRDQD